MSAIHMEGKRREAALSYAACGATRIGGTPDTDTRCTRDLDDVTCQECLSILDTVTVTEGQILVNNADIVLGTRDVVIVMADCHTKYAEAFAYGGRDVLFIAGQHTLRGDRDAAPTIVTMPKRCEGWTMVVDQHARYSLRIVAYRPGLESDAREVWRSERP